jgi:Na+/proline symporter
MSPGFLLACFLLYTGILFVVTWVTARRANNDSFYIGNKQSPWYIVAYGMIGASLSGVTFMSVPGWVGDTQFSYLMVVFGYFFGYFIIATVLMPMYYRLNLTSIYTYLLQRFGFWSYKTGAFFFLLSRSIGASFRMFLVVNVLQLFIFDAWGVPFGMTVAVFIILILLYTFRGGIKTIIWTDTLQTTFMLLAVVLSVFFISGEIHVPVKGLISRIFQSEYSKVIVTGWQDERFFLKQFLSGIFITIAMTGLDQEMMQKNLSCRSLRDAKKNMFSFSFVLVMVNLMFLMLGAVLFIFAGSKGMEIPARTDDLFPVIALQHLGPVAGIVFMIGLISAAYPSADGALTALTTSFSIDFLGLKEKQHLSEMEKTKIRYIVHFCFAALLLLIIVVFRAINDRAVIDKLFTIAGYTYGPLLGLFSFGLFTKFQVKDKFVPVVTIISPVICYVVSEFSGIWFGGYKFGFELLILNGLITFAGLLMLKR